MVGKCIKSTDSWIGRVRTHFRRLEEKQRRGLRLSIKKKTLFIVSEICMVPGMGDKGLEMRGSLG